ncbi:MAG: penicillin-binding transpeptidase domain-containing protein [Candidatus Omnitrophota bacterium]
MYIRKRTLRFISVFLFLIACLLYYSARLAWMQVFRSTHLANLAAKQHNHYIKLEPVRGTIYDRRLRHLALNMTAYSLFANPRMMSSEDKERAVRELSSRAHLDPAFIRERLARPKYFVWISRKLPDELVEEIKALKIPGLDFIRESKRYYPNRNLAAHVIGFAGMDNVGLDGLELKYNEVLKGKEGWTQILRDAKQRDLMIEKHTSPPQDGFNLVLTIDETIQYIAERALDKAFQQHKAKGATIIVMDPHTGEILALANRPTYDLENFIESAPEQRTNRGIAYVYEPGSVFKIVTASAALEEQTFQVDDKIFCENGEYRVGNHILHDSHPQGTLTFQGVIEQSSNIGTTKIAQKLGAETVYRYARAFQFSQKTGIDLLGEEDGLIPPPSTWSKTSIGAVPIGHEVTVTPLQLVCAISAIANGGIAMKPFVVKYIKDNKDELIQEFFPEIRGRVISSATAERMKAILQGVVDKGTGKRARIEGLTIAGKTGTAQKVENGQYSHSKYYATFIGFAPVDNPRVAAVVVFDEPSPSYYGGTVAAPVFREMLMDTIKYLRSLTPSG